VSCYLALDFIGWLFDFFLRQFHFLPSPRDPLSVWHFIHNNHSNISLHEVAYATALSIPIACLVSWIDKNGWVQKLAIKWGLSDSYGDQNLYSYYLRRDQVIWVYVRDAERKLTYRGKVFSFSENDKVQEIVLVDVTVFGYEYSVEYYVVPDLYLCRPLGCLVIESAPEFPSEDS
jgi:hypothetical protein